MSADTQSRSQPARRADAPYVSLTYRYLRLGMVTMVGLIFVSFIIQAARTDWVFLGSISEYYYTPAQFVLVAALVAIGVCLIAIRGRGVWEDGLLNLAGIFAGVVAIVPTPLVGDCLAPPTTPANPLEPNVENNLLTFLIVGSVVLAGATVGAVRTRQAAGKGRTVSDVTNRYLVLLLTIGLAAGGWWAFFRAWDFVTLCAHPLSALGMFACMLLVVAINSRASGSLRYTRGYGLIAGLMAVVGAVVVIGRNAWYEHWVLLLEMTEIALFAAFWILQTVDQELRSPPAFDRSPVPASVPSPVPSPAGQPPATDATG